MPVVSVRGAARVGGPTLPVAGRAAVGPYVKGSTGEVYELIEQLQSALFGGVYRARGLKSGRDYAVKVLHKRELAKMHREARGHRNVELCEMPLSEVTYASKMRDNDHVLELLDHSEDDHCHYLASPLARGGDLLEALKEVSNATESGFQEKIVKCVVAEAAQGIAHLHSHGLALQDVSLENMLLFVDPESGNYTVKICDPGQATEFTIDKHGREEPIHFKGLLGKSFRPPELYSRRDYIATAVDSWCLGWSIFYLLTARSLFQTADPRSGDKDWIAFSTGDVEQLFRRKGARHLSRQAKDLILKLMQLDPRQRLSVDRVLDHPWFVDKPSPGRWPAPSHLVIEEREMLAKIRARLGTASRGASTNAPSDSGTVVEASAETVRERTGSTTSTTTESQRTSLRGPRLESIDSVNRTSIGSSRRSAKQVSGAHRMDSRPSMASVRSAIALNAYHTRLSRSPSPPPQRVPFSSIPKWTTVVDTMNIAQLYIYPGQPYGAEMAEPYAGAREDGTVPSGLGERAEAE
ncbi:MAP kinase-interacting serine/threonine-protein kinase, putative [Perkinsus marinus ATCC 50983]|uniref:MAP kinase-interacting serine/threonine-protein kinase, putative n=1 Tax=Perkinsus marinus (strain ATCC 50983 / TXsc) TaxID=423536 RepID=C5K5E3_PERM5|nr:MAP kinase-interacting serine/threonine-protein kinase, putative [Perkinsus marinus ATCC 50983]EER20565.1 MAP kinase-interacting serine/threonine-protein kinase, putative [Perkinsus marinus ATCC 50983]|eukprot:XP_002788769.1 MAP kinase-interacting serine/threonine-protein kinase, putative [Perkinsus marinus ATCC 50983]